MYKFSAILLLFTIILFACSKKTDDEAEPNSFSFTYKGQTYSDPSSGGFLEGYNSSISVKGIYIRRPDLFGGEIKYFFNSSCAYLSSDNKVYDNGQGVCQLKSSFPIDSATLFLSQSTSKQYTEDRCKHIKRDQINAPTLEFDRCIVTGTFAITLKNKNDSLIEISGSFSKPYDKK